MKPVKISVLGNGGWGTTLALILLKKGFNVYLWGAFPEYVEFLKNKKENQKFLPGIPLPDHLHHTSDISEALSESAYVVMAVPSQYMRSVVKIAKEHIERNASVVSVAKGIEAESMKTMTQVISDETSIASMAVLSGPSHAEEVACGIPASVVVASPDEILAQKIQNIFMTDRFRVYTNQDLLGVELAGAVKNVIALAAGISDGLGYGDNTKSALVTRGLAEMTRLGVAMGAKRETFFGLAGVGDLMTTAFSRHSRNRRIGELIGTGLTLEDALNTTEMVAEGVRTSVAVKELAKKHRIEMPICQKVYEVLYENLKPLQGVQELMMREAKPES